MSDVSKLVCIGDCDIFRPRGLPVSGRFWGEISVSRWTRP